MKCLEGYIGLKGCGLNEPLSNRYVNSLPGISLKVIDNIANNEQVNYAGAWKNIQERAIQDFKTKVTAKLASRFRLKQVLQNIDIGETVDELQTLLPANEFRGFTYQVKCEHDKYFKPSALQHVYVQCIKLYAKTAGIVTVKIFDLDKKKQVFSKKFNAAQGWNTVTVHQSFKAFRLFFAVDATAFETVYQELDDHALTCCAACTYELYGDGFVGWLRGAKSSTAAPAQLTEGNNTYGLSAEIALHCSFDNVVCKNLPVFEDALWYKHGEEVMIERIGSPRFNLTTIDTEEAQTLQQYFMSKFNECLDLAISGIDLNLDDVCIACNAPLYYGESRM